MTKFKSCIIQDRSVWAEILAFMPIWGKNTLMWFFLCLAQKYDILTEFKTCIILDWSVGMEITRKSVYIFAQENVLKIKSRITELYLIQ